MNSLSLLTCLLVCLTLTSRTASKKKDIRDYTDADMERLYEQWEENDEEELPDDEKPEHLRPKPGIDVEELKKMVGLHGLGEINSGILTV